MIKRTEDIVLSVLKENKRARSNDFILYGGVLKRLGIDLKMSLANFLANASLFKAPSFETVTRCRRHIQELMPDLKESSSAIKREEAMEVYKEYNLSGIGK